MPRLKPDETEERRKIVRACVSSGMELYDVSEDSLAARIGVTTRTVHSRRDRPENYTLGELWAVSKALKWTPIQAASIVLGRPLTSGEIKEFILM